MTSNQWPFKNLAPGESVTYKHAENSPTFIRKATSAAHAYGSATGKQFHTMTSRGDKQTKVTTITRVDNEELPVKDVTEWPFKEMPEGDMVELVFDSVGKLKHVQRYIHAYASGTGKKFKTKMNEEGNLLVKRVPVKRKKAKPVATPAPVLTSLPPYSFL